MATAVDSGGSQRPGSGTRPRSKSVFSITSDHSEGSKGGKFRLSQDEKRKQTLSTTTKANPNAAINELQPIAQQLAPSTLASLRSGQHVDMHGNVITDPDPSNPTRRRLERPLETIMSFERAIDREYRRQRETARQSTFIDSGMTDYNGADSRRSSAYWGPATDGHQTHRTRGGSYFPENGHSFNRPSRYGSRQNSDPALNRFNGNAHASVYSTPGYGQTRETINTGGSNGSSSEPWRNDTDPSSDNSSVERMKGEGGPVNHHGEHPGYGPSSQQRGPISENGNYTYGPSAPYHASYNSGHRPTTPGGAYYGQQFDRGTPAPPPKQTAQPRQVMKLDSTSGGAGADYSVRPSMAEAGKRKSWLKRTFSKNKA